MISVVKWGALAAAWFPFTSKSAVFEATFSSATDVPVAAVQYQASGNEIALSLGFPPSPGVRLTVVNVTGLEPIVGAFSNLSHGQTVVLNHGGNSYPFVANYFGGDGNDLVLHWADTEVYSWGSNTNGQLGVPKFQTEKPTEVHAAPVALALPVSALRHRFPVSIACGPSHTLALCSDGALVGWGGGQYGKLGNGATSGLYQPTEVVRTGALAGKTVKAIAAGENFSLALCADGTLAAWGLNNGGQLGQGPGSSLSSAVPILIPRTGVLAGRQVVSIAAGGALALAVCGDGSVVSWGSGARGEAGTTENGVPGLVDRSGVLVARSVVSAATNGEMVLAVCSDGSTVAWGRNDYGQLGVGDLTSRPTPVLVDQSTALAGKSVVAGAVGRLHSVVLCSDGSLASWGYNSHGPLGTGTRTDSMVPVAVDSSGILAGRRVVSVSAGWYGNLAVCSDGFLIGWGLVNITVADPSRPFAVGNLGVLAGRAVIQGAVSDRFAMALCSDGTLAGWGNNFSRELGGFEGSISAIPVSVVPDDDGPFPFPSPVLSLANGQYHSHALLADGSIRSWGENRFGQLGVGSSSATVPMSSEPLAVAIPLASEGRRVAAVAAGERHSVALCTDGSLFAWGSSGYGLLGANGIAIGSPSPIAVDQSGALAGKRVIRIWAQEKYSMALCSDGSMATWGENFGNEKGNEGPVTAYTPVLVANNGALAGKTVVNLAAGPSHLLALCSDGSLVAWGWNTHGSLGDGSTTLRTSPVAVDMSGVLAGKSIVDLAIRTHENIVLCSDGTLAAWGSTDMLLPLLPNGASVDIARFLPAVVDLSALLEPEETPIGLESSSTNLLITTSHGRVIALGFNGSGQLGKGSTGMASGPSLVDRTGALSGATVSAAVLGELHATALANRRQLLAGLASGAGPITVSREMELEVSASVSSIVLTPVAVESTAEITIGGQQHASGAQGAALPLSPGPNPIPIRVTASNGDSADYLLVVRRGIPPPQSALASLAPNLGDMSPGFEGDRFLYTIDLPFEYPEIRFTPSAANPAAGILIDGSEIAGGGLSDPIPLPIGATTVQVRVNAPDGIHHSVYTVTVHRAPPPPASLTSLGASSGSLSPVFQPSITTYRITVSETTDSIRWLPQATDSGSTISIAGTDLASGTWSEPLPLLHGVNRFTIAVTNIAAETISYAIDVTRTAPSSVATLKSLKLKTANLTPAFRKSVTSYEATVSSGVKSLTVTAAATDGKAMIRINGKLLKSGQKGIAVPLTGNRTVIRIVVTSAAGNTRKTYTITAKRTAAKKAPGRTDESAAARISDEPPMTYQDWVELHFDPGERGNPGISGMQAAPHGDGLPNLVKFALGLGAGPAPASELPRVELADGNLFMTYRKLSETSGCRILVEAADSPSGPWSELRNASTVRAADGSVTFKVADEVGVAAKKNRFLRLKVVAD